MVRVFGYSSWESIHVADTPVKCRTTFDGIWDKISNGQIEKLDANLQSSALMPRRRARATAREAEDARRRQAARSREYYEKD